MEIVDVSTCKKNLVVEVPAEEVDAVINDLAQKYAQKAKVPGFRPGRVPLTIVKQRFASELRSDATQDLINRYWKTAVSQHDLHPLAQPTVEQVDAHPGNPLKFTLSFEVLPPIDLRDYRGVNLTLTRHEVSDSDVDEVLDDLREQNAHLIPVEDGEIRDGHLVTLTIDADFGGAGKPLHEENAVCIVGDSKTNESFSENLRGKRLGESAEFDVTYPPDYHGKRFAGKSVHYRVEVKDVRDKQLPELNDDFAKDVVGQDSIEALRTRIRQDLVTKAQEAAEKNAMESVLDQVVGGQAFEVPETLVREELEAHARRIAARLAHQGIDVNKTSIDWRKIFEEERPRAETAVRRALVLDAVARQESLEVAEEDLSEEFRKLSEVSKKSAAALRAEFEKSQRIHGLKEHLRRKKALDFIYRNANISRG